MTTKALVDDILELSKARLCLLALLMASIGFALGSSAFQWKTFVMMWTGTAFIGAASGIFNQYLEREIDREMNRTKNRPLASGRFPTGRAVVLGYVFGIIGELFLLLGVNLLTAFLGALTLLLYIGVYTPSKKISPLSTLLGTVPGAIPPLMGWTAATGHFGAPGLLLFLILVMWQVPHFLAIAWFYKEDYRRGGLPVLSVVDTYGAATAKQVLLYLIVLLPLSVVPSVWNITGHLYLWGAIFLGLLYAAFGVFLAIYRNEIFARRLFLVSILYLPLLGLLMVLDKVPVK